MAEPKIYQWGCETCKRGVESRICDGVADVCCYGQRMTTTTNGIAGQNKVEVVKGREGGNAMKM